LGALERCGDRFTDHGWLNPRYDSHLAYSRGQHEVNVAAQCFLVSRKPMEEAFRIEMLSRR
jgi:hypothetical protein